MPNCTKYEWVQSQGTAKGGKGINGEIMKESTTKIYLFVMLGNREVEIDRAR